MDIDDKNYTTMSSLSGRRRPRIDALRNAERILDATAETIAAEPGATLEQIARAAGVSRATLYAHFGDRDGLLDALTERSVAEMAAAIAAARPDQGGADKAIDRVLRAAWGTIGRYRGLVIINRRLDPHELRARTRPATSLVRALIERGQASREFDPNLSSDWLLLVVLDLIHSASRQVTAGALTSEQAERALLRSAHAALRSHRL
jgi:AcrR family transcriptional regulator